MKDLENVLKTIEKGAVDSCYLLYGDEEFLIKEALESLIDHILPFRDRDLNLFWVDSSDENINAICNMLLTPPLIGGKKIIVIKNTHLFYSKKSAFDLLQEVLTNLEADREKAKRSFEAFLKVMEWSLVDLKDNGWRDIPDEVWQDITDGRDLPPQESWLPRIINLCNSEMLPQAIKHGNNDTMPLEEILPRDIPQGNCLILTAPLIDKRKRLFKIISECGIVLNFPKVKGESKQKALFVQTVQKKMEQTGKSMSLNACQYLGDMTGFDLECIGEELSKLIDYTAGKTNISQVDVAAITVSSKEDPVFGLTEALAEKNTDAALTVLRNLMDQGIHYLVVLAMITREIRFLFQGKCLLQRTEMPQAGTVMNYAQFQSRAYPVIKQISDANPKNMKKGNYLERQHPYVIYNTLKHSTNFTKEELLEDMEMLITTDMVLKTSQNDPGLALKRLVIKICN